MSIKIIKMFLLGLFVVIIFSVFRPRASSVPTVRITRQSNYSTVSHLGHTSNWLGKLALIGPTTVLANHLEREGKFEIEKCGPETPRYLCKICENTFYK